MPPALEVAEVFRRLGDACRRDHGGHLDRVERRVMSAIEVCRTAAPGGHAEACEACGTIRIADPATTGIAQSARGKRGRAGFLHARASFCQFPYFHVVFTLPPLAAEIAFQNKALVDAILMRTAAEALMTQASRRRDRTPRCSGACSLRHLKRHSLMAA